MHIFRFLIRFCLPLVVVASSGLASPKPNIILMFADDMGYADPVCFGGTKNYATPHLDRLAKEGIRLTDFYVSSAVCSASRAALMTGCYHERVGIRGALGPASRNALNLQETTVAEMLAQHGYATGMVGKWHLGDRPEVLPPAQGFGSYFGLPYSNDMWPDHPESKFPPLPLYDGTMVINPAVDKLVAAELPTEYTKRAVSFIEKNAKTPFFLYLAHNMPHVPLGVHPSRVGKSAGGVFGDVMQEIDWSVGQVLDALDKNGISDNTLVIFTSDNGPWLSYGNHAGSCAPLREGKGTSYEGGVRVPFMARWPGKIPAGQVRKELAGTIDILPTLAEVTGSALPKAKLDGVSIAGLLQGKPVEKPLHEALFFYYNATELQSMRSGPWKLYFPHTARTMNGRAAGKDGIPGKYAPLKVGHELYNLESDIQESTNLYASKPEVVAELEKLANGIRRQLGDRLTGATGTEVRPCEQLDANQEK